MKSGNSWSFVNLCVDFIYVLSPMMVLILLYMLQTTFPAVFIYALPASAVLLILEVIAVAVRISNDSAFVILHEHERVIVESMKIAHMDVPSSSDPKGDSMYKELYDRVVLYFDLSKPYLDGNLTINDVVKEVYSNKVYISKAIFHYTGRNFRQFVNYYRVIYSMDLFRANLEFKVAELAEKSGFNTMVSYTMAFRLFMNETPSEWCRRERAKILKKKK
jgi:AraC-like DNA-binding protein